MMSAPYFAKTRRVADTQLPTHWGMFRALVYERDVINGSRRVETAVALVMGDATGRVPLVRIHSQCFTGEILGSLRCDCRGQFEIAMQAIASEGCGLVVYEYQEGRGIGLTAKLQAYALQDAGLDTFEANHALGLAADCRDFALPAAILKDLGIGRVRLLSHNPEKSRALRNAGITVVARVPCEAPATSYSLGYLKAKREKMGHAPSIAQSGAEPAFASVATAMAELRAGRMVVVVDDTDRENEGDLVMAAEMVTPQAINFMATQGRGLICLAMTGERVDQLKLPPMAGDSSALGGTAFTVSIDARGHGMTTGISAYDRAHTIRTAIDPDSRPDDFARPGHVFPLRARTGGVLERRGHTEAAVDLARLAGLQAAGVVCEIVNDDGSMARAPDLARFCRTHKLVIITVADLVRYRRDTELVLEGASELNDVLPPKHVPHSLRHRLGSTLSG